MLKTSENTQSRDDDRRHPRVEVKLDAMIALGPDRFWPSQSVNISEGGVLFQQIPDIEIPLNSMLQVHLVGIISDENKGKSNQNSIYRMHLVYSNEKGLGLRFI